MKQAVPAAPPRAALPHAAQPGSPLSPQGGWRELAHAGDESMAPDGLALEQLIDHQRARARNGGEGQ